VSVLEQKIIHVNGRETILGLMADSASASRSDGARASRERVARAKREAEERGLLTLSTILRIMEPAPLTVELNDDTVIVGMLDESDAYMKCAGASPILHSARA
jgi:hypothetical protein